MPKTWTRYLAAVPDTLTALTYLCAWVVPTLLGVVWVRTLKAAILIEFMVLHASAIYAKLGMGGRVREWLMLGLVSMFYLLLMVTVAARQESWWPVAAFFWLFTCRFAQILLHPATADDESLRALLIWLCSVVAFGIGAILSDFIRLPVLGITRDFATLVDLPSYPKKQLPLQMFMAFGAAYFLMQAWLKIALQGFIARSKHRVAKRA